MKRLATSQTSRYKNRRNTSGIVIKDNFDDLDNKKKMRKAGRIAKNPCFYNNVKQKLNDSSAILTNARTGGTMKQDMYSQKLAKKRNYKKEHSVISIIRRKVPESETRPFSAYPLRPQTVKYNNTRSNFPISSQTGQKTDNRSIEMVRGIQSGFCIKRTHNKRSLNPLLRRDMKTTTTNNNTRTNIFSSTFTFEVVDP